MNASQIILACVVVSIILFIFYKYIMLGMLNIDNIQRGDECCLTKDSTCDSPISCNYLSWSWLIDQFKFDLFTYAYMRARYNI